MLGCGSKPLLQGFDEPRARKVSSTIDSQHLEQQLQALSDSHLNDTPIACAALLDDYPVACHLTHEATRAMVVREFEALGILATQPTAEQRGTLRPTNVVAEIPGARRSGEFVLLGAHYDAYYSGADDNSSGVAALLELARVFTNFSFERTIRLVAFDLHELGFLGSSHYVETEAMGDHAVVLVLDSLGNRKTSPESQPSQFGLPWPSTGDFLMVQANAPASAQASEFEMINDRLQLTKLFTVIAPGNGDYLATEGLLNGDQVPFWLAGVKTLAPSDTPHHRDDCAHSERDIVSSLDLEFLSDNTRMVAAAVSYFAEIIP